jgi:long-chain acyl-CoA synthetase
MPPSSPWLANHPPGVRAAVAPLDHPNLGALATAAARRDRDGIAFTCVLPNGFAGHLTFATLDRHATAFARHLLQRGVRPGDRVALVMPNILAYPIAALGVLRAGAVVVNVNPLYTERELRLQIQDSGAVAAVVVPQLADRLAAASRGTALRHVIGASVVEGFPAVQRWIAKAKLALTPPRPQARFTSFAHALAQGHRSSAALPVVGPDDLALLQYTGGTTGTAKGAMLTHRNLLANLAQVSEILRPCLTPGNETELVVLPLYHVFAFTLGMLLPLHRGARAVLVPVPRPLSNVRAAVDKFPPTFAIAVSTLLQGLQDEAWFRQRPPSSLVAVYAGGTAVPDAVRAGFEQLSGALVVEGFGLSEASPLVTYNPAVRADGNPAVRADGRLVRTLDRVGGVGLPLPSTEVRIVDDEGNDVAPGQPGELLVRGPQVMQGYWQRPDETAATLRDGWLRTGDVAVMDELGYLRIVDRMKDMILVSGFNVYPAEVETCLAEHPQVAEVAVVGVPDETTGEAVQAFVVRKDDALTEEELRTWSRTVLTGYKVPRHVRFVDALPKNVLGKVLRRELRGRAPADRRAVVGSGAGAPPPP